MSALGHCRALMGLAALPSSAPALPHLGRLLAASVGATSRWLSTSAALRWPDVVVPQMGESIKEGSIAAVLKQVGQPVREDEVIAQIETDKVTIDIKAPAAGVLQRLTIKPGSTVVAGQVVASVGAEAVAAAAADAASASPTAAAAAAALGAHASTSGRPPMISFPPRVAPSGERLSSLPEAEYQAALAAIAKAQAPPLAAPAAAAAAAAAPDTPAPAASPAAPPLPPPPPPAAKAAPPPPKNKLTYVTRPDGRGGPPRRPLTARELDMVNLGGAF